MVRCYRIQNPIGQLQTVTKISTGTFVITRRMCHRCIYLLVTVIIAIIAYTIEFLIKTYLIFTFLIFFWWLGTFCNLVIFGSTSKCFYRCPFCLSVFGITRRRSFFLLLSELLEIVFLQIDEHLQKSALCLNSVCSFTISSKT